MVKNKLNFSKSKFTTLVEIIPPFGSDFRPLESKLDNLRNLPIDGFNIATNPLAKPKMDSLTSSFLVQRQMNKPAILHCTTRDQNKISIQAMLWGAKALGINAVIAMTGDLVLSRPKNGISPKVVQDIDVLSLISIARANEFYTGVVVGHIDNRGQTIKHFKEKVKKGAQFAVTQPIYSLKDVEILKQIIDNSDIPVIMGVMPLQSMNHAQFISKEVEGIFIPDIILERISCAKNQLKEGIVIAREMLCIAQKHFAGACIMPPSTLKGFNMLPEIFKK